jgi:hypothetical protein
MPKRILVYKDKIIIVNEDSSVVYTAKLTESSLTNLSAKELQDIIKCTAQKPDGGISVLEE